jgi:diguanylate cyclase (GGDEF)-like protein
MEPSFKDMGTPESVQENKSAFDDLLQIPARGRFALDLEELGANSNADQPLSLLLVDLDKFKQVNDLYGHEAGDEVLKAVASVVRTLAANKGRPYRYGGDEIVMLLPNHTNEEAISLAERIRQRVEKLEYKLYPEAVTLSIGAASYPTSTPDPMHLFADADRAMYTAKDLGGNAVRSGATAADGRGTPAEGGARLIRSDVASRVEAVELWMSLQQASDRYYAISFENDNDEDVLIEGISLRTGTLYLCRFAKAKEPREWLVSAHSRKFLSGQFASDPTQTLRIKDPQLQSGVAIEIDIVVRARILGRLRTLSQTILATVDYGGRRITQFGP